MIKVGGSAIHTLYDNFTPAKMPAKPKEDDPLLKTCYNCRTTENLSAYHGVKVCPKCDGYNMTMGEAQGRFGFSKKEIKALPHTTHHSFRCQYHLFNMKTLVRAAIDKYGSLYNMIASRH
mmetsp:Transcript_27914/g.54726  ORF Transcript_27914/g.54726 Transcript_27914/m.54726 type:complete len:120 (+) Transcript_27914:2-361(+)